MANLAAVAKVLVALVTDEKARKCLGWALVAILAPVIVTAALVCSLAVGAAENNVSAVQLCFSGGIVPAEVPEEYRAYIQEMQSSFVLLDRAVDEINGQTEGGGSLDATCVKAIFYALFFGEESPGYRDHRRFADCFVDYETRTRLLQWTDEGGNEQEREETYTVAVPLENLAEVYQRIGEMLDAGVSAEQKTNAESVYQLAKFGYVPSSAASAEPPFIGADGFCSPIGENWRDVVTSEFGYRRDPFTGLTRGHTGMDLAVSTGTPVRAALAGTVTAATYNAGGYGYYVMIDHGDGLATLYGHNSRLLVQVGQQVEVGDVVSLSGSTGRSTGPHLHFEVRVDGERTDPRFYLP